MCKCVSIYMCVCVCVCKYKFNYMQMKHALLDVVLLLLPNCRHPWNVANCALVNFASNCCQMLIGVRRVGDPQRRVDCVLNNRLRICDDVTIMLGIAHVSIKVNKEWYTVANSRERDEWGHRGF